jgi:hypothetical protein
LVVAFFEPLDLDFEPPDDFLAVLAFFAMALCTSFLVSECTERKNLSQYLFLVASSFFTVAGPPGTPFAPAGFPPRPLRASAGFPPAADFLTVPGMSTQPFSPVFPVFPVAREFSRVFIPLFVAIDAFGLVPVFLAVTGRMTDARRRRVSFEAVGAALLISIAFMFLGDQLFQILGITDNDFRIAGGVILLVPAVLDLLIPGKPAVHEDYPPGPFPL